MHARTSTRAAASLARDERSAARRPSDANSAEIGKPPRDDASYAPDEPHHFRRREILAAHPEIRALFGYDTRVIAATIAVVVSHLAIAIGIQSAVAHTHAVLWAVPIVAYGIGALLNHFCGVVSHEASHNLCARTARQNRWLAIFANLPVIVPFAMSFRRYHMNHHRFMGVEGRDNDLPLDIERRVVGHSTVRKILWFSLFFFFGTMCRGFLRRPNRWEVINWAVQMPFNVLLWRYVGPVAVVYLFLSTYFSLSLHPVTAHFVQEHHRWDDQQETYSYYGPLNRVTLNFGHHTEHHDFVNVPGARLPQLRAIASEYYENRRSHQSAIAVMWRFIMDGRMSHHARFLRAETPRVG